MAVVEVKVPDIGDFEQVEVIELLVKAGDKVVVDQSLLTVESDKASMEIPSSQAGIVKELKVKIGDKVAEGSLVLMLEIDAAAAGDAAPLGAAPVVSAEPAAPASAAPASGAPAPGPSSSAAPSFAAPAAPSAGSSGPATSVDVLVPDLGDFADVAVIEVMVKVGDTVKVEQSLLTVEGDKASMEIPSSHAGLVRDVKVKVGDQVSKGSVIATLDASGAAGVSPAVAASTAPKVAAAVVKTQDSGVVANAAPGALAQDPAVDRAVPTAALPAHEPSTPKGALPHASPSIRKAARELGVPLDEVKGSGPNGRITPDDLNAFVKAVMAGGAQTRAQAAQAPAIATTAAAGSAAGGAFAGLLPWPQVDFAKFGAIERRDLSRIRKISGANLHRNWVLIPHVTNHDDADITELEAFRLVTNKENEKAGIKVTMLAFLIKATVAVLKKFPDFNSSLEITSAGEQMVLKKYFHIGFAADTPNGLMVPVIRDCDQKGVLQISQEMSELAKKARDGKLSPAEMSGGCFSISSLGGIGGRYFTPIINAPEVAILGVCKSAIEAVWDGKAFQPRLMLPLSLSWDHRVLDGASAARFNAYLGQILSDFRRVLL